MISLHYTEVPSWPRLAWLARCPKGQSYVEVYHGSRVEVRDVFFGELTWAGDFDAGAFDQTDIIAGSGGRCRGKILVFVSSGSAVDRLHFLETSRRWLDFELTGLSPHRRGCHRESELPRLLRRFHVDYFWNPCVQADTDDVGRQSHIGVFQQCGVGWK